MNRLAEEIRIFSHLINKIIRRDQEERLAALLPGITGLQFGVMRTLQMNECTLADLSNRMMVTSPTLIPVIDQLERKGLLRRVRDRKDRRKNNLLLTEKGKSFLEKAQGFEEADLLVESIQSLGIEKSQQLNQLLQEVLRLMSLDIDLVAEVHENLDQHYGIEE